MTRDSGSADQSQQNILQWNPPGTQLYNRSAKAMCSNQTYHAANRPTNQQRHTLKHPHCPMLVSHFSLVPEQRHFYPTAEPIIIRLPCPQMAIVEMEAPFSQINFEKSRRQSYRVHCKSLILSKSIRIPKTHLPRMQQGREACPAPLALHNLQESQHHPRALLPPPPPFYGVLDPVRHPIRHNDCRQQQTCGVCAHGRARNPFIEVSRHEAKRTNLFEIVKTNATALAVSRFTALISFG